MCYQLHIIVSCPLFAPVTCCAHLIETLLRWCFLFDFDDVIEDAEKPWIAKREGFGQYHTLMAELELQSPEDFVNYLRMPPEMFYEILTRISSRIEKV